jgi:Uma2 family endonuclease
MSSRRPRALIAVAYAEAAHEYLRSLPPEHFMEATSQATQRKITLESLDLVHARRPDVQVFNELLVQYPRRGQRRPGQVVPDNMVVICDEPIDANGSYDVPLQSAGPFWVLEYVSKHNRRKDYDDNFDKYEKELKVLYFLLFYPETQDMTLYRHTGKKYQAVPPNGHGRHPIPDLELEVELRDGWVRFWFRGELLPLPGDLQRELDEARQRAERMRQRADQLQQEVEQERQRCLAAEREVERLRAELGRAKRRRPEAP